MIKEGLAIVLKHVAKPMAFKKLASSRLIMKQVQLFSENKEAPK